jgi:hypothetical protein
MNDDDKPATKGDLIVLEHRLREFIFDRESALTWRVIGLTLFVIAAMSGAQITVFLYILSQHTRP